MNWTLSRKKMDPAAASSTTSPLRLVNAGATSVTRRPKIAIVIPAYNEEKNIEHVLQEIERLRSERRAWDILPIVVNDGSADRTAQVLARLAPIYGAEFVSLPLNLGIGRAVQTGFRMAVRWGADVTLQLDGDGQHPAAQIPEIVRPVLARSAEVVVGSRYVRGAGGNVSSTLRQAGTFFFSRLLRTLVSVEILDTTSGFRAFDAEATEFLSRHYPDDYPEVQAYVPLARKRFRIMEVPVTMRPRKAGRSSITPMRSVYYMGKVAFATIMDMIRPLPPRHEQERPHFDAEHVEGVGAARAAAQGSGDAALGR